MDPTLNALAYKLQFETLEEAAPLPAVKPERRNPLLHWFGGLLVSAGQKLQAQAAPPASGQAMLDAECVC